MFRHELFHIEQKHSWDILYLELLSILFWINPFFHLIKKEVKAIHEFLADEFAISENNKWEYAELLLMQALNSQQRLVNSFFNNQIKRRIAMITASQKSSYQYLRKILVLPIAAIVIALFAFTYKIKHDETIKKNISREQILTDTTKRKKSLVISGTINLQSDKEGNNSNPSMKGNADLTKGPNWIPPTKNGHILTAYKKQPVTYVVEEKNHSSSQSEYPIPLNEDYNDPTFRKKWHEMISEIKAIAWKEGKAAYEYRGRTYVFGQIKKPDSTVAAFTEQNGTGHVFLLNGKLIESVDGLNALITRNDVKKFGFISQEEMLKRFNRNEASVFIETYDEVITRN